ncbi:hypothetical protein BJV85_000355 [Clostridium acetobutylicum]|uniref:Methyl-accepting chemotaxis protein n=1 Tax=Clostridium acetobutylicum (strain ATCC 824 / DSM 792 / JCM 1419 / IAM 19013 / LMG 5710 / NBRC 13948 / NRRL B-527 / VKM B-1787 / 2291 / W) TaxID=272562 RepID=Q97DD3_CLOAB|nr:MULTISPECIES: methyl-accepting chemotaxis protein [Clostridium]AAK81470.1 Methyl-accepting chemotaxis protein [Clostridium acetobutylicum ATCC 824]ADZ22588.1 Methyl-accepting chemotaxis protein [Clostridium acetobutylicum EA 2018]AEI34593.1 methyl-accepting chemotaxis protein [Clostridium acetobutylicum DSM 1731]AWV80857.1 methyl-accepting chemotaxis protein [Clostridium acetobutylicum]MBC2393816.1 methyl-accepting chemotaxis protein [Clostridium acetobutylicum]
MEKIFESLIDAAPTIAEAFGGRAAVTIWDRDKCVYALDSNKKALAAKAGDKFDVDFIKNVGAYDIVFNKKKTYTTIFNREEHGEDLRVTMIPAINENKEVVGLVSVSMDLENAVSVKNSTLELKSSLEQTNLTISEITNSAVLLSEKLNRIIENTDVTKKLIGESNEAVALIGSIAKQSNLLGLNAAIESSKAGEFGKGFSVVAGEMRKLASNSGESSRRILSALDQMSNNIKVIIDTINELGEIATNQAASLEEVSATVEQISANSQILVDNMDMN